MQSGQQDQTRPYAFQLRHSIKHSRLVEGRFQAVEPKLAFRLIQKRIETVSRIQQQLNLARQELAQAARQTRILSKLKERRRTEYDTELRRTETRDLDEVSQNIFTQARSA